MFLKLLKHDIKKLGTKITSIYLILFAILFTQLVISTKFTNREDFFGAIAQFYSTMSFFTILGISIISVTTICRYFYSTMYSPEGYQTFTIPTSTRKILLSKFTVLLTFYTFTFVAMFGLIFLAINFNTDFKQFFETAMGVAKLTAKIDIGVLIFVTLVQKMFEFGFFIVLVMTVITLVQNIKNKKVIGTVLFLALNAIVNVGIAVLTYYVKDFLEHQVALLNNLIYIMLFIQVLYYCFLTLIMFAVTEKYIAKNLNI